MLYLVSGVLLFSLAHLVPAYPVMRNAVVQRLGENVYKGVLSLFLVGTIVLMVFGWRSMEREFLFVPPGWVHALNVVLMLLACVLFLSPYLSNNLCRLLRHPQLTGLLFWGVGHVLATGQTRSLLLFGGLALWALFEMWLIGRRDGAWIRPERVSMIEDLRLMLAGLGLFALFAVTHVRLFGVSPIPAW